MDAIKQEVQLKLKDNSSEFFVYCRSGRRSETVSEVLVKLGYTNVYNLGGINDLPYVTEIGAQ